ncbi:conserved hypothetical protein [Beggiatoa sp. PS]|nr:conserved hypothetical protein [Beggiatoa sp. PS]
MIEKDKITPEERRRMKEEYNEEKAKKDARDEGWKEGEAATQEKTARNLRAIGTLTDEQIANATGLSLEMVKAL